MKQITLNYKSGIVTINEVPEPATKPGGVLVQTFHSLISAGTEKNKIDDLKKHILGWLIQTGKTLNVLGPNLGSFIVRCIRYTVFTTNIFDHSPSFYLIRENSNQQGLYF